MIGEIFKLKIESTTMQTFIMSINNDESFVILFDNVSNSIVGDLTKGINIDDIKLSSIRELSEFIINNNY